jgi:hypothetical protein
MKKFMIMMALVAGLFGITLAVGAMTNHTLPAAQASCSPPNC